MRVNGDYNNPTFGGLFLLKYTDNLYSQLLEAKNN